jgi:hypothetical protein
MKTILVDLARHIRPMKQVVRHILDDKVLCSGMSTHLEDVEDHIEVYMDEVARFVEQCNTMNEEYVRILLVKYDACVSRGYLPTAVGGTH